MNQKCAQSRGQRCMRPSAASICLVLPSCGLMTPQLQQHIYVKHQVKHRLAANSCNICSTVLSCTKSIGQMTCHYCYAGAFICATNHYLKLSHPQMPWDWRAITLNPYHEGNDYKEMIADDALIAVSFLTCLCQPVVCLLVIKAAVF